jgi:hypothetical protein
MSANATRDREDGNSIIGDAESKLSADVPPNSIEGDNKRDLTRISSS